MNPLAGNSNLAMRALTETPLVRIRPTQGWRFLDLKELWRYRELIYFFTWRDIKVRYKQTAVGAAWAIIQPLFAMVVFNLLFGRSEFAKVSSEGIPYPIFLYSALVAWTYFANSLTNATNSLVTHHNTITKVYFPRVILPLSSVLGGLLDFATAFTVLIGMMFFYHIYPTGALCAIPLFVLLTMVTAFGVGLWLSALNVQYRDIRYAITFLVQIWFFATPVFYQVSVVLPPHWQKLYKLNPMVGIIDGFRGALLGNGTIWSSSLAVSIPIIVLILVGGIFYFHKMEQTFADVV